MHFYSKIECVIKIKKTKQIVIQILATPPSTVVTFLPDVRRASVAQQPNAIGPEQITRSVFTATYRFESVNTDVIVVATVECRRHEENRFGQRGFERNRVLLRVFFGGRQQRTIGAGVLFFD